MPCPGGSLAGTFSVGSDTVASLDTGRSPKSAGVARLSRHRSVRELGRQLRPPLPDHACGTAADLGTLHEHYRGFEQIVLSIDGLQPEKGHETLYVVRELLGEEGMVCRGVDLGLSRRGPAVDRTGQAVGRSSGQIGSACGSRINRTLLLLGSRLSSPGVPHRYCANHFLRDLAKPVLEADSHAKVQMRKKVRGLRGIERSVLDRRQNATSEVIKTRPLNSATKGDALSGWGGVVLDYCAAVRGILNDDQGGPLHPPGLRMAEALGQVHASLDRSLSVKKGFAEAQLKRLATCIDKGPEPRQGRARENPWARRRRSQKSMRPWILPTDNAPRASERFRRSSFASTQAAARSRRTWPW